MEYYTTVRKKENVKALYLYGKIPKILLGERCKRQNYLWNKLSCVARKRSKIS